MRFYNLFLNFLKRHIFDCVDLQVSLKISSLVKVIGVWNNTRVNNWKFCFNSPSNGNVILFPRRILHRGSGSLHTQTKNW